MIPTPRQNEDIFDTLIRTYHDLTRSETKVADYILRHKNQIHSQSISELAAACDVSEATISRFCHSVGCASFNEFKLATVQAISSAEKSLIDTDLYSTIQASDSIEQKCRKLFNVSTDALQKTLSELNPDTISEVVQVLSDSTRVPGAGSPVYPRNSISSPMPTCRQPPSNCWAKEMLYSISPFPALFGNCWKSAK